MTLTQHQICELRGAIKIGTKKIQQKVLRKLEVYHYDQGDHLKRDKVLISALCTIVIFHFCY